MSHKSYHYAPDYSVVRFIACMFLLLVGFLIAVASYGIWRTTHNPITGARASGQMGAAELEVATEVRARYDDAFQDAQSSANLMRLDQLMIAYNKEICQALSGREFRGWPMELVSITPENGYATITARNDAGTFLGDYRIDRDHPRWAEMAKLDAGDQIIVAGRFSYDHKGCFIMDDRLPQPAFQIHFNAIHFDKKET